MRAVTRLWKRGALAALCMAAAVVRAAEAPSPAAIQQDLRSFATVATVLHVAAHPDDENTQLITYLARGRGYRTGYLSVTRGDGGQNEIGPEFGEKLGLARTQELLAARNLDGGVQFFTRALDFGYSKRLDEALKVWDHQALIGDVVRVIRTFRPDVIVTRFAPVPQSGNHGHHNASAVLALEAFKVAGDPKAFPEQIAEGLAPWQPKRIFWNSSGFNGGGEKGDVQIDVAGIDPVLNESFGAIASRSRAKHITQFGRGGGAGGGGRGGRGGAGGGAAMGGAPTPQMQSFNLLAGEPAKDDIMDGIDTTWNRVPGGAEIAKLAAEAVAQFKVDDPGASVPALLAIRAKLVPIPVDPVIKDKRLQLDRILEACLGLSVATSAPAAEIVPGEKLALSTSVSMKSKYAVRWVGTKVNFPGGSQNAGGAEGGKNAGAITITVPADAPVSHPYWLREESTAGMFRVADAKLIGTPENPPPFTVDYLFEVEGQKLTVSSEPLAPNGAGKPGRRVAIISPVSLRFGSGVALFTPGAKKQVDVDVTAARAGEAGSLRLEVPTGWAVTPATQAFKLSKNGEKTRLSFTVTAPAKPDLGTVLAIAEIGGVKFTAQRVEINYDHIPLQLLQAPARLKVSCFAYETRGKNVGYLPGAGDDTVEALEQLGYTVKTLTGADLTAEKLKGLDAVVIGVRAFNERTDFAANFAGLMAYVEAGGTVISQYNRPNNLKTTELGPYPLSIQGPAPALRVTEEDAPVVFLDPGHMALNRPNKLGPADFAGWVQERGAYFPSSWDKEHYTPLFAMSDPGEKPLESSVLVAKYGKGYYVYTGLGFFRQLPAGVPGGFRLFANLLALGKE